MDPTTWDAPFPVVYAAMFVIVMFRANATYWLGRAATLGTERTRLRHLVQSRGYARASGWIERWGPPAVTVSFLTIGVQTLVNLAAGVMRMPLRHYLPAVTGGCLIWALVYSTVGVVGLAAFRMVWERSPAAAVACVVVVVGLLAWWVVVRVRGRAQPDDEPVVLTEPADVR